MKKQIYALLFASVFVLLLAGCKNPYFALPQKDGVWNFTQTINGSTAALTGTATFTKSNVTWSYTGSSSETGTWTYDNTTKTITYKNSSGDATVWVITDVKRKSETWTNTETNSLGTFTTVLKMVKK